MRIPYPERISYTGASIFAAALLLAQILEHTDLVFAACCFCYILVATAAFNVAGGLYRPAGAYIFFNALLTLIVGLVVKACLGEPAQSNLAGPTKAIEVYLLGMVSFLIAAFIESQYRPKRAFVSKAFPLKTLRGVYIGAAIIGVPSSLFWLSGPQLTPGSFLLAFRNTDQLVSFAMIIGVIYNVRASNGRRSMSPLLAFLYLYMQGTSLITFSKQALFTPVFCWVLGAGLARYRLKPVNFICVSAIVFVLYFFGTPYVGVGKGVDKVNLRDAVSLSFNLLQNMSTVREEYKQAVSTEYLKINYYNQGEGVLDRLQMLSIDALLIQTADDEGYFGFEPTKEGWENVVPHLIWKDKPTPFFGNYYAHRLGLVADDDVSTGVSFGVTADSYFEGGFFGVLVIQTLCFLAIFTIFSFVIGSVREHPAVILLVVMTAHVAPEGQIPGAIGLVLFCLVIIGFAFFCRYVFPLVADTFVREPSIPQPIAASAFAAAD